MTAALILHQAILKLEIQIPPDGLELNIFPGESLSNSKLLWK